MKKQSYKKDEKQVNIEGALSVKYDAEDVFEGTEPWERTETILVVGSFAAALFFLVVLGTLINIFILK